MIVLHVLELFLEGKIDKSDELTNLLLTASTKPKNSEVKIHEDTPIDKFGVGVLPIIKTYKGELIWGELGKELINTIVSSLLSTGNKDDDETGNIKTSNKKDITALEYASELIVQSNLDENDEETFIFVVRENPEDINIKKLSKILKKHKIFFLTDFFNFQGEKVAALGSEPNMFIGHIYRNDMHFSGRIDIKKERPGTSLYLRVKREKDKSITGKWTQRKNDAVSVIDDFYLQLFLSSAPVMLNGTVTEGQMNRVTAKVRDVVEILKAKISSK
ncbi:MAG: hypothetical protein ACTSYA_08690 [Candidatus Kariarchaeaceae archaeon]